MTVAGRAIITLFMWEAMVELAKILPRKNNSNQVEEVLYRFILALDDKHKVVDGSWLSSAHHDFMTIPINFIGADRTAQELPPKAGEKGQCAN